MQRVKYNGCFSEWKSIDAGVPQGTKFGPVGFIVLINELVADIKYMDDSTLYKVIDSPNKSTMCTRINDVNSWATDHKMVLNERKTVELRISFKRKAQVWPPILINNTTINTVHKAKLLGFILNDHLNWNDHVETMLKKANKRIHFVKTMLLAEFPKSDIVLFYCAAIRSVLEYGAPVWHYSITKKQSDTIKRIQRRVLKLIEKISHRCHDYYYTNIMCKYNLITLKERRRGLCGNLFKCMMRPEHPLHCILPLAPERTQQLCKGKRFMAAACRTKRYHQSFLPVVLKDYE